MTATRLPWQAYLFAIRHSDLWELYLRKMRHWPHMFYPRTYNEKMQWRKLFDHDPRVPPLSDKIAVRDHFRAHAPDLPMAPILWTGTDPDAIPADLLDEDVVIKANNASARNLFLRQRALDPGARTRLLRHWLTTPFGRSRHEWAYTGITPKLLIEPVLRPADDSPVIDMNFDVFDGTICTCFVTVGKTTGKSRIGVFDGERRRLATRLPQFTDDAKYLPDGFKLPPTFQRAANHARDLGRGFDQVRVDFMAVDDALYGCEMTFYSLSGFANTFTDRALFDYQNSLWDLRKSWFLSTPQQGWRARYADTLRLFESRTQRPAPAGDIALA